jgi:hypothetical protein
MLRRWTVGRGPTRVKWENPKPLSGRCRRCRRCRRCQGVVGVANHAYSGALPYLNHKLPLKVRGSLYNVDDSWIKGVANPARSDHGVAGDPGVLGVKL